MIVEGVKGMGIDYCFKNGEETIVLMESENKTILNTANVLPYDYTHDQDSANDALKRLSMALDDAGIQNFIRTSKQDLI